MLEQQEYSLNVKGVKRLPFKGVKSVKPLYQSENRSQNEGKLFQSEWKSLQKIEFHFLFFLFFELTEGQLQTKELSLSELPKKVKFTLLEWFSLFLEWFSLALE